MFCASRRRLPGARSRSPAATPRTSPGIRANSRRNMSWTMSYRCGGSGLRVSRCPSKASFASLDSRQAVRDAHRVGISWGNSEFSRAGSGSCVPPMRPRQVASAQKTVERCSCRTRNASIASLPPLRDRPWCACRRLGVMFQLLGQSGRSAAASPVGTLTSTTRESSL